MPKRVINVREGRPFLDLVSYPRGGSDQQIHLSRAQIEQIARTVRRTPEVVIKVLPKDSNSAKSIQAHINYIGRKGNLEIETDDGTALHGKNAGRQLLEDWDLDLEANRRETEFSGARGRRASKLVHKLVFSMPPGTPPQGVLAAVRNFAREKFALLHRYAMVLHIDEPHPHVHVVVKAVSEQGVRLSIGKETLREWRARFAHYLREEGIAANATDRFIRGATRTHKLDGMYRAATRGDSTHIHARAQSVARSLLNGNSRTHSGKRTLLETRQSLHSQWRTLASVLAGTGHHRLAKDVEQFVCNMPPPRSDQELLASEIASKTHHHQRMW